MTGEEIRSYIQAILPLDPLENSEEIFSLRKNFFDLSPRQSKAVDAFGDWYIFTEKIEEIRKDFWEMTPENFSDEIAILKQLSIHIKPVIERIQAVFNQAELLVNLQEKFPHNPFFSTFGTILIASPKEAIFQRTKVGKALKDPLLKKSIQQAIGALKNQAPDLYHLEEEWLLRLEKSGKSGEKPLGLRCIQEVKSLLLWGILIIIVILFIWILLWMIGW